MEWDVVLPRFARLLTQEGSLAIVRLDQLPPAWSSELAQICQRYTTVPSKQLAYDYIQAIAERGFFQRVESWRTKPVPFSQSVASSIESFHGRASF